MDERQTMRGTASIDERDLPATIAWMAEQIPGGFFVYRADDSQEMLYVNEELLRIFGCATLDEFKELTGYTFRGLVHPDDFDAIQGSIDDQIADEENKNLDYVEYRIIRRDGSVRWVDDYGHFTQLPGFGDVYYVFVSDITEKHLLQEETRRRSNIYEGMLEQYRELAAGALAVYRANATAGVIEEASGSDLFACDVAGGPFEAAWRARLESFLNEADRDAFERDFATDALVERYWAGAGPATLVAYCRRASGRQCFVRFTGSAVVDPVTAEVLAIGLETEYDFGRVSEILNEKVLASQFEMICYLVSDHLGVVVGQAGKTGVADALPLAEERSYSSFVSQSVLAVACPEVHDVERLARELSLETVRAELAASESYSVDVCVLVRGAMRNKRLTYHAVEAAQDFYILIVSDVTEVVRDERRRNELLANALREAERANVAKTSFLSNMSHEIRTPMNAILGYDTIALKDPALDPKTRGYLQRIGDSAKHLLGLINDILDMSRIESGRMTLRHEEFSFRSMIEQVNTLIESLCADKGLTFRCRVTGRVEEAYLGDDMKLKQVIINMLSNAVKFTDPGGTVTFCVESLGSQGGASTMRFTVTDTGIGMDEAFLPHIFEAFAQEEEGAENRFGSTGLGMAITKNIVDMMGGTITVSSVKGEGSEFAVTVTLDECPRDTGTADAEVVPSDLRVLVVDDEDMALEHARFVLAEAGIACECCQTGDEALGLAAERAAAGVPFDLVIMDWRMPLMDGVEATRLFRERLADDATVILLATYNRDDVMEEALEAGVDGFTSKPLFASSVLDEYADVASRRNVRHGGHVADLEGRCVLVAEDVDINAEILVQVLGMRDMRVERARDGQEALERFSDSPVGHFDAILMDVKMPRMDGLEACRRIRALTRPDARTVPIVALTANAFDEDVAQSLEAGMSAHLSKPVEIDALYSTLEELILD